MVGTPRSVKTVEKYQNMKQKYMNRSVVGLSINVKNMSIKSNDMSATDLRRRQTEAEKNVNRLRNCLPEKLATFCKMHLSFLLELDGSKLEEMFLDSAQYDPALHAKKKNSTPFSTKKKERHISGSSNSSSSPGCSLSKDNVRQIFKLIGYLEKRENLCTEGLFRKTGNVSRQRLLREWIQEGAELQLHDNTFSPHDVATVLKQILSELHEPLLTQKLYEAHIQIVGMMKHSHTEKERQKAQGKQLKALQLLTLLLPRENAILLEALLDLLHRVASEPENKMSASSLGVVFAPSLICPRKLSPEEMQSVSVTLSRAITTMIENSRSLFMIPQELGDDVANFWREMEDSNIDMVDNKENISDRANIQKAKYGSSSAVNTVLTFAERKSPEECNSSQDTQVALAQLYAHVQSMPESAKKKKLLKQFNRASGLTPVTPASNNISNNNSTRKGKHRRSRTFGESLKKHFPILAKHKLRETEDCTPAALTWSVTQPINIDDPVCSLSYSKTPDSVFRSVMKRNSPAVHIVDLGASPCNVKPVHVVKPVNHVRPTCRKRLSDEESGPDVKTNKLPHLENEITYMKNVTPCKALYPMMLVQSPAGSYTESVL